MNSIYEDEIRRLAAFPVAESHNDDVVHPVDQYHLPSQVPSAKEQSRKGPRSLPFSKAKACPALEGSADLCREN